MCINLCTVDEFHAAGEQKISHGCDFLRNCSNNKIRRYNNIAVFRTTRYQRRTFLDKSHILYTEVWCRWDRDGNEHRGSYTIVEVNCRCRNGVDSNYM